MAITMQNHVRHPVMWIPLVLVGSILYWTVALGLGGMSLSFLGGTTDEELVTCPGGASVAGVTLPSSNAGGRMDVDVRIVRSSDFKGLGGFHADDGTGRLLPIIDQSPPPPPEDTIGRTSY
jgi:hypothetical protein